MIANIEHANGKLTITTTKGEIVSRKTDAPYVAAIVARHPRTGKLTILVASKSEKSIRDMWAKIPGAPVGSAIHCKFGGWLDLEMVTKDAGWEPCPVDPTGEKADAALLARRK